MSKVLTLTSDPIISEQFVQENLDLRDDPAVSLINGVSAAFLRFTRRIIINRGTDQGGGVYPTVTEQLDVPVNDRRLWLHGGPVTNDASNDVTLEVVDINGDVGLTYSLNDGDFRLQQDQRTGHASIMLPSIYSEDLMLQVTYAGGFATLPGDVLNGALMQMRVDRDRHTGKAGLTNYSRSDESVSYESGGLIKAAINLWSPYQVAV